nr:glucose-1-phosphate adenylyltransferase [Micromonospora sp. DSM 115978]
RSVVMDNVVVGRHATVRGAILDKNVVVEPGATVGVDAEHDRARGFTVSPAGTTVVGKGVRITR